MGLELGLGLGLRLANNKKQFDVEHGIFANNSRERDVTTVQYRTRVLRRGAVERK